MKTKLIAALLIGFAASAAAPAFASGYGPAPFYRPSVGAPASQRGESAQTLAAERDGAANAQSAYGGVAPMHSEAGGRVAVPAGDNLFAHH